MTVVVGNNADSITNTTVSIANMTVTGSGMFKVQQAQGVLLPTPLSLSLTISPLPPSDAQLSVPPSSPPPPPRPPRPPPPAPADSSVCNEGGLYVSVGYLGSPDLNASELPISDTTVSLSFVNVTGSNSRTCRYQLVNPRRSCWWLVASPLFVFVAGSCQ